jgi:hypothetical protein
LHRRLRVEIEVIGSSSHDASSSFLADRGRLTIRGETAPAQNVIQSLGRIAADNGAMRWSRCGVQGVTLTRREEVGEHPPCVRVDDGQLTIELIANEGRDHDGEGTPAVEPFQGRPETGRLLLQAGVLHL